MRNRSLVLPLAALAAEPADALEEHSSGGAELLVGGPGDSREAAGALPSSPARRALRLESESRSPPRRTTPSPPLLDTRVTGSGAHDKRVTALLWSGPTGVRATFSAEAREDPVLSCLSCLERRVMTLDDERQARICERQRPSRTACAPADQDAHLGEQRVPLGHRVRAVAPRSPLALGPRARCPLDAPAVLGVVGADGDDRAPAGRTERAALRRGAAARRSVAGKEAARQSATDAGPQAFYDELALARLKRWGGTSSGNQANPRRQIANPPSFDNGVTEPPSRGHLEISIATDSRTFARSP